MTVANPIMIVFMAIAMLIGNAATRWRPCAWARRGRCRARLGQRGVHESHIAAVIVLIIGWNPALVSWVPDLASATPEVRPFAQTFIQILCAGHPAVHRSWREQLHPHLRRLEPGLGTMVIGLWARWPSTRCSCWRSVGRGGQCPGHGARVGLLVLGGAAVLQPAQRRAHAVASFGYAPEFPGDRTVLAFQMPSFCVQAGMAIVNFVINFQLVRYGAATPIGADDALAAIGVVQRIASSRSCRSSASPSPRSRCSGSTHGAHNVERVRKTLWYGIGAASSISLLMFVIVEVFAVPIAHAFGISHDGLVDSRPSPSRTCSSSCCPSWASRLSARTTSGHRPAG